MQEEEETLRGGYKRLCSLQSIRVKWGAAAGGERSRGTAGGKRGGRTRVKGWRLGKYGKGPIKVKARRTMNDLVLKRAWRHTHTHALLCKAHIY